jgi:hypothetical protein
MFNVLISNIKFSKIIFTSEIKENHLFDTISSEKELISFLRHVYIIVSVSKY